MRLQLLHFIFAWQGGQLSCEERIGQGTYGQVFAAREKCSSRLYALKIAQSRHEHVSTLGDLAHEFEVLQHLGSHAHVVPCLGLLPSSSQKAPVFIACLF